MGSRNTETADTYVSSRGKTDPFIQSVASSGLIPAPILRPLLERAGEDPAELGRILLGQGLVDERQLQALQSEAYRWEVVDLQREFISDDALSLLPKSVAQAQHAVPFSRDGERVSIAILNPDNGLFRRMLQKKFRQDVRFFLPTATALDAELKKYNTDFHERFSALGKARSRATGEPEEDSVIELLNALLLHGISERASDIHIEPTPRQTLVRERIDGLLRTSVSFSKAIHHRLVQRIKVMANLATDEHSIPQDGKLVYWTPDKRRVDVRVSIVPVAHGEKTVMRLLPEQTAELSLDLLGCAGRNRQLLEEQSKMSYGMILATGPTGSGKSTTLYTLLQKLNVSTVNVSTIEDPVEYEIPGANQIQVNEKTGLTFAEGLRSLMRQDPNIMLVGEIRDRETAGIAVNAAMTGHMVLSTLHTNNAATAIPRLIDMQVEPFLIASVVNLILAQRLVRKICPDCLEWTETGAADLERSLPADIYHRLTKGAAPVRLGRGKGCEHCNGSGFRGRTGIFEVLPVDLAVRQLILRKETAESIQEAAVRAGMTTMMDDGLEKVRSGITTLEEFLRVIRA